MNNKFRGHTQGGIGERDSPLLVGESQNREILLLPVFYHTRNLWEYWRAVFRWLRKVDWSADDWREQSELWWDFYHSEVMSFTILPFGVPDGDHNVWSREIVVAIASPYGVPAHYFWHHNKPTESESDSE